MMTATEFSLSVEMAAIVAQETGRKISQRVWSMELEEKSNQTFGTSSTSDTDKYAEANIIEKINRGFPNAICVGEESAKSFGAEKLLQAPLVFFIDPRDGTTEDSHELSFWCVSIGIMEYGELTGGAIFAQEERGGLLIVSERNAGVHLAEHGGSLKPAEQAVNIPAGAKPLIHLGLDVQRLNTYNRFIRKLPKELKPRGISASGALGLALVAAGRIDAIAQSPQFPWDWTGAMAMAIERKLAIHSYRVRNGLIVPVAIEEAENFRTDRQTLGFVVGKPGTADPLFESLVLNYGEDD